MWSDRDYHVMWHVTCGGYRLNTNLGDLYNFWSSLISELVSRPSNKPITWQIFNHVVNMILCFFTKRLNQKVTNNLFPRFSIYQSCPDLGKFSRFWHFLKVRIFFQILHFLNLLSRVLTCSNHGNFLRFWMYINSYSTMRLLKWQKRVVLLNCHDVIGCQFWIHKRLKDINSFI